VERSPEVALRRWRMLVLDAFKCCVTPEVKTTITSNSWNSDLVIPGGDYLSTAAVRCSTKNH
jgi:hypothetical protein